MDDFKDRYIAARTEAEREAIFDQIRAEMDTDAEGVAKAVLAQITETNERAKEAIIKDQIGYTPRYIAVVYSQRVLRQNQRVALPARKREYCQWQTCKIY